MLHWTAVCLAGYLVKLLGYAVSTTLSHVSAYRILEGMRLQIADRLLRAPLGTVLDQSVGKLKSVIVDRVETIELPLAHLIPEGISNLLLTHRGVRLPDRVSIGGWPWLPWPQCPSPPSSTA